MLAYGFLFSGLVFFSFPFLLTTTP
ncbi:hypothetical protein, partial [Escherichia coli]